MRNSNAWPADLDVLLRDREPLAVGDADHLLDQIDAGHLLGHRVLHLDARIDLDEVEATLLVEDELDGARGLYSAMRARRTAASPIAVAVFSSRTRTRALLEQFLVAPLDRTIALAEMHDVAVLVGEDLHLDVARSLDELLHVDHVVAEAGHRFRLAAAWNTGD